MRELARGEVLAERYRIDEAIGSGGTAAVYRAIDQRLGRAVALKVQHRDVDEARERLMREARVLALVQGPGLLRILDVGEHAEVAYLATELLQGETLGARAANELPDLVRSLTRVASVARTMAKVHAHGIVHRDLKPDNVFLDRRVGAPGGEVVVILDFGLAFATDHEDPALGRLTNPDETAGTPAYMPPEQICDIEVGPPADVYALGCVLYELLAGDPPFTGDRPHLLSRHLYATPVPIRDRAQWVPLDVEVLLEHMLVKSPARRPTMTQVAEHCRASAAAHEARALGERPESRTSRAVTIRPAGMSGTTRPLRVRDETPPEPRELAAELPGPSRRVLVLEAGGAVDSELHVALAASELEPTSDPSAPCDVVLALGIPDAELARWLASGTPVVASAASGDLELATRLVQRGVADVVTTPIRADVVARKLLRILRVRARRAR